MNTDGLQCSFLGAVCCYSWSGRCWGPCTGFRAARETTWVTPPGPPDPPHAGGCVPGYESEYGWGAAALNKWGLLVAAVGAMYCGPCKSIQVCCRPACGGTDLGMAGATRPQGIRPVGKPRGAVNLVACMARSSLSLVDIAQVRTIRLTG